MSRTGLERAAAKLTGARAGDVRDRPGLNSARIARQSLDGTAEVLDTPMSVGTDR